MLNISSMLQLWQSSRDKALKTIGLIAAFQEKELNQTERNATLPNHLKPKPWVESEFLFVGKLTSLTGLMRALFFEFSDFSLTCFWYPSTHCLHEKKSLFNFKQSLQLKIVVRKTNVKKLNPYNMLKTQKRDDDFGAMNFLSQAEVNGRRDTEKNLYSSFSSRALSTVR